MIIIINYYYWQYKLMDIASPNIKINLWTYDYQKTIIASETN